MAVMVLRIREVAVEVTWAVEVRAADSDETEAPALEAEAETTEAEEAAEEMDERTLLAEAWHTLALALMDPVQAVRALLAEDAAEEAEAETLLALAEALLTEAEALESELNFEAGTEELLAAAAGVEETL